MEAIEATVRDQIDITFHLGVQFAKKYSSIFDNASDRVSMTTETYPDRVEDAAAALDSVISK
jgi:hypothetical protein